MEGGTIEQTLPGFGGSAPASVAPAVGRAVGLAPSKRLSLFSGGSNPVLAEKIAEHLEVPAQCLFRQP